VDQSHLLILATDRVSAFDVILPTPIPGKGALLTTISNFWFEHTRHILPNHLSDLKLDELLTEPLDRSQAIGRAVIVKRLQPLPVEAIARGYLIGSGWKDYCKNGAVCGISLRPGLRLADRLPEPLYTPSTKAKLGDHDENIEFERTVELVGVAIAQQIREATLRIYTTAASHARARGIIIADTKFEFGLDEQGQLTLMDEVLTPDSSRFWPADAWQPGKNPPSFDKQFVRDYLDTLDWNKTAPGPVLPADIVAKTAGKYQEAVQRLMASP
jgi:phosphoribosylaminoimidazole-succinocarboxamide synthase